MRLIRPYWLTMETADGVKGVDVEYFGALVTKVVLNGEAVRVPTADLMWKCVGADSRLVAYVTNLKDAKFTDAEGKTIAGNAKIRYGYMCPVLEVCLLFRRFGIPQLWWQQRGAQQRS